MLIISYVPLLRAAPGVLAEMSGEKIVSLLDREAAVADGVVWMMDALGSTWPAPIHRRAREVHQHLVEWSEGDPSTWFDLRVEVCGDEYALALVPRMERSVERFRVAAGLAGTPFDPAVARVLSVPLAFAGPKGPTTDEALARVPARVRVGFVEPAELARGVERLDQRAIATVGPIHVARRVEPIPRG